jgi:hypothetical protein
MSARRYGTLYTLDLGDGWTLTAKREGSWTSYRCIQVNADGYAVPDHIFDGCRRRDAMKFYEDHKGVMQPATA